MPDSKKTTDYYTDWLPEIFGKAAVYRIEQARRDLWNSLIQMLPDNAILKNDVRLVFERADLREQSQKDDAEIPVNFIHYRQFKDQPKTLITEALETYQKYFKDYLDDKSNWNNEEDAAKKFDRLVCWQARIPIVGFLSDLFAKDFFHHQNAASTKIGYFGKAFRDGDKFKFTGKQISHDFKCDGEDTFNDAEQKMLKIGAISDSNYLFEEANTAFWKVYLDLLSTEPGNRSDLLCFPVFSHNARRDNKIVNPPMGTFLGWIRLELEIKDAASICEASLRQLFMTLSPLLDGFAKRLLVDEVAEVIGNKYTDQEPLDFLRDYMPMMSGWSVTTEALAVSPQKVLPFEWRNETATNGKKLTVWLTGDRFIGYATPITLTPKPTTQIPEDVKAKGDLGGHEAFQFRSIYRELESLHKNALQERKLGQQSGILASAHDYSKEVGGIGTRLNRFNQMVEDVSMSIREQTKSLSGSPVATAIDRQLERLEQPRIDWFSQLQFNHAHLQTDATGILTQEPAHCIALLEKGTLSAINELVRILVWLPQDYGSRKLNDPATWCLLFSYEIASDSPIHQKIGEVIRRLILIEKIEEDDFPKRFPMPKVILGEPSQDGMWESLDRSTDAATRRRRLRPLDRLLPLLVFTLRFAFQCAWARTLLLGGGRMAEAITISANSPDDDRQYRIHIQFPVPGELATTKETLKIPYLDEWRRQISRYEDKTGCWKVETKSVTLDKQGRLNIFLRAAP